MLTDEEGRCRPAGERKDAGRTILEHLLGVLFVASVGGRVPLSKECDLMDACMGVDCLCACLQEKCRYNVCWPPSLSLSPFSLDLD